MSRHFIQSIINYEKQFLFLRHLRSDENRVSRISLLANFLKHSWPLAIQPRRSRSINEPKKSKIFFEIPKGDIIKLPLKHRLIQCPKGRRFLGDFHPVLFEKWQDFQAKGFLNRAGNGDGRKFIFLPLSVCLQLAPIVILIKTDIIDSRVIKKYSSHKKFTHRSLRASTLE